MATAAAAARSVSRSVSGRNAAARLSSEAKTARTPFRIPSRNSLSNRIFSWPVEMSACLESLQPFHTATASALMTFMLTLSQRGYGWLPEGMDQIGSSQKQKKARISWKNENVVKTFLEACIQEVRENGREGASLKKLSWKKVGDILKNTHNFIVDQKQMKNHYDYQKGKYGAWSKLKNKTGNVYDLPTNTFNLSKEEWNIEMKTNKYVEPLRTTPLVFPDLCVQLFDGAAATGVQSWGPSSTKVRSYDDHIMLDDIEEMNNTQDTTTSTPQGSSSHVDGRRQNKKKKSSKSSNLSALEEDMSRALKVIIDRGNVPSIKECQDKLRNHGWASDNPLYKMTLVIFCESPSYRESWMIMQDHELEEWVRMLGRRLGLV